MKFVKKLAIWSRAQTEKYGAQYKTFGIFGIINYPLAYFYEVFVTNSFNTEGSWFRLISTILCLILAFKDKWAKSYENYLPLFYHSTVCAILPIFITFMLLKNQLSLAWMMNFNVSILILILLLDLLSFLIIEVLGLSLGTILFYLCGNRIISLPPTEDLVLSLYMFFCITILGAVFSKSKEKHYDFVKKVKDDANAQLENKVVERTIKLQEALAAKTEFLNNMSHEVRTPIQGIVNISQGLVDQWNEYSNSERLFFASKVAENGNRLTSLVSNLLDLSKFGANKMIFDISEVDLIVLINQMIKECKDLYIKDKNIELKVITELDVAPSICDQDKITQVLRNLFANAIKFTDKGNITARLDKTVILNEAGYKFNISDSGIGIPEGEEKSIFDPFTQSSRTKTNAGGTGLGLAICKRIIEGHSGSIKAANNSDLDNDYKDNVGTTIEFTIPKNFPNNNKEKLAFKEQNIDLTNEEYLANQLIDPTKQKTILLIDDEDAAHFSMNMIISKTNYKLMNALGGVEGLKILKKNNKIIDLVLLDLMMADLSGIDFLKKVREDDDLKDTKIILQTGTSDEQEFEYAKELGVISIINKPYDKAKILNLINKFI